MRETYSYSLEFKLSLAEGEELHLSSLELFINAMEQFDSVFLSSLDLAGGVRHLLKDMSTDLFRFQVTGYIDFSEQNSLDGPSNPEGALRLLAQSREFFTQSVLAHELSLADIIDTLEKDREAMFPSSLTISPFPFKTLQEISLDLLNVQLALGGIEGLKVSLMS